MSNVLDDDSATNLQKILKMSTRIFMCLSLNGVACTMLMRLGLSLNSRLLVLSAGPVRMFSVLRAENSRRVLSAIAQKLVLSFLLIRLILIGSCWRITTNCTIPYIRYEQRQTRVSLLKQSCYDFINKYLFDQFSIAMCPSLATGPEMLVDIS